ncbi:GNAT family N-acetyltransferase [Salipaludibacillus neizhouensis]|uniref:GNAT family N-acetyltransferase n=1 Tax=Salipaludibacillus neizhouensis TaxID=885475 RepID=A0A3A9K9H6_9BACI|nr:GNAT family N-acetyltransferase [Salipaludibacillus neizhouensis]RKL68839.1 GNAT family N-acetyltransferase [Salipaludibacillus neizhouensis]
MVQVLVARTVEELRDVYDVRRQVFIEEQGVPAEIEVDEKEKESIHLVAYHDNQPIGAGRLRLEENYGKAERVCILAEMRGKGLGAALMKEMEQVARERGMDKLKLNAQTHAESFYKGNGYATVSDTFYDAGILHVTMEKKL